MLRITSKQNGFRRCGVAFTEKPVDYSSDQFTEEEITILKKEPMLVVIEIPDEPENEGLTEDQIDEKTGQKPDKKTGKK